MESELDNLNTGDEDLEQLTDEFVQVFCFKDIDNSTEAQKEELIQRILKLGGNNYSCEDLRRDLLCIEAEDNIMGQIQTNGNVMIPKLKDKGISFDNV